ncbi:MAG: prealbumin-like fold domain-containing protein [Coriobacteriales bacterium]
MSSEAIKNSAGDQIGTGFTISNDLRTEEKTEDGRLTIAKTSQLNELLGGAKFGLYSDKACTDKVEDLITDGGDDWSERGAVTVSTADVALAALLPAMGENRTLYLREDQAPKGYVADSTVHQVTISASASGQVKDGTYVHTTINGITVDGATEVKVPNAKTSGAATVHSTKPSGSATNATRAKPLRVVAAASAILPQTGDGTSYLVPAVIFVAGIALVILGARKRRS